MSNVRLVGEFSLHMNATSTKFVDFDKLLRHESTAPIVVKLMMACNDLSIANEALVLWKEE
jgi:hypothetical protein